MSDTPSNGNVRGILTAIATLALLGIFGVAYEMKQAANQRATDVADLAACRTEVADKDKEILAQTARADRAERTAQEFEAGFATALTEAIPSDIKGRYSWSRVRILGNGLSIPMQIPCNSPDPDAMPNADVFQEGATEGTPRKTITVVERTAPSTDRCWSTFTIVVNDELVRVGSPDTIIGIPKGRGATIRMPQSVRVNFYNDDVQYVFTSHGKETTVRLPEMIGSFDGPTLQATFYDVKTDLNFTWEPPPLP